MPAFTFLYNFFHNETNDRTEKGAVVIPLQQDTWPETWKKIEYKNYKLFTSIKLVKPKDEYFWKFLQKRHSRKCSECKNEMSLEKLAFILKCGYGLLELPKSNYQHENRTVPSAGRLYPLEIYVIIFKNSVEGLAPGVYHYGIKEHALEPVFFGECPDEIVASFSHNEAANMAQGLICISSVFSRNVTKYGSRGYRYILLEAGHVAQNILLAGSEIGINSIPVGGCSESAVEKYIGLGTQHEKIVYTLFF
jgi:SagB-type dehydrogenase family enzyme